MLIDNIMHVYNAIWPWSLLKFKNFKRCLNQTWWSIRIECLLSWSKQSVYTLFVYNKSCTQEYLSQPKVREKSRTLEKTGRRNKRSLGRDVAPPPSVFHLLSVPGGGRGDTACCVFLSACSCSLSLHWWDSCALCTDSIFLNYL